MRKLLNVFWMVLVLAGCTQNHDVAAPKNLEAGKVYFFFSASCSHCHDAMKYINAKYPHAGLIMVNVHTQSGIELLIKAADKFGLGDTVGTPLIVFGDRYLMGWSKAYEAEFDAYIKPYLKAGR